MKEMRFKDMLFEGLKASNDDDEMIVEHIISSETMDRQGDIMRSNGCRVVGKPVVLLCNGMTPLGAEPIGRPLLIETIKHNGIPAIKAKTLFFNDAQGIGRRLYQKTIKGVMPYWSIGYIPEERRPIKGKGWDVTKWQLLQYSIIGVSMNPDTMTIQKFFKSLIE